MMTEEVKTVVKRHRHAAVIGGAVGLAVLAGYIGYVFAVTPKQPVLQSASPAEVVAYISNKRGLAKLPRIEQQAFLTRWREHIADDGYKAKLTKCFENLAQDERKRFTEAIFKFFKRAFVDDARHYAGLTDPMEQSRFLRSKVEELRRNGLLIQEVAGAFKNDFGGPDALRAWLVEHTTPRDRQVGEPYAEALKRVGAQMKKEARAAAHPPQDKAAGAGGSPR
ncbi:MAG: hypothetical protein ACE5E1_00945 [Phycisphaerae bacterium]